jgi:colanic acid biosynthesis glycosyl transferase WcaI
MLPIAYADHRPPIFTRSRIPVSANSNIRPGAKGQIALRILLHGINYSPELTGVGKYSGEMAEWLAAQGHQVRVVTAPPYYPAWRVRADYRAWCYRTEPGTGPAPVRVYRTPIYVPGKPSGAKRVLHLASFMVSALPIMLSQLQWEPELVLVVEPTLMAVPAALLTAYLAGAVRWLHIQDFEVDAAFDLGLLPREGWVHSLAGWLERSIMHRFHRVSTISEKMLERLPTKGAVRTVFFPNWVDTDAIAPLDGASQLRRELGLGPERIVMLYAGNMGMKQGLEVLPVLARRCSGDPRLHFIFCGEGAFQSELTTLLEGAENVTLLPLQPFDRLNDLLNTADIHLLPQRSDAADLVMPSKLTGMLASGRPVVATAAPGTQVARALQGCGLVVPPGDAEALYAAVTQLANSPALRQELGRLARAHAVQHLGRDSVLAQFESELRAALAERQAQSPL